MQLMIIIAVLTSVYIDRDEDTATGWTVCAQCHALLAPRSLCANDAWYCWESDTCFIKLPVSLYYYFYIETKHTYAKCTKGPQI